MVIECREERSQYKNRDKAMKLLRTRLYDQMCREQEGKLADARRTQVGTGLFRSRQKYRFLPFAESDFILSIIGEELGFVGIVILFLACTLLIFCGIRVARRANDFFSFLLAAGITLVYGIQTVLNALVVSGSIPPTGLPLPLISSGNTSLIITMASMGILYSISRQGTKKKKKSYDKA